jgi:hypothetical protein
VQQLQQQSDKTRKNMEELFIQAQKERIQKQKLNPFLKAHISIPTKSIKIVNPETINKQQVYS